VSDRSEPTRFSARLAALALAALALAALTAGCSSADSGTQAEEGVPAPAAAAWTEEDIQLTIETYAELLAQGFAEQDMAVLEPVATVEQAQEEYALMAALGEGGIVMYAQPNEVEIVSVTESDSGGLIVETREIWDYEHISLETSETVRAEDGVVYELRYALVPATGGWVVASIESVAEEGEPSDPSTEDTGS
jgi:hypothetical protein